MENWKVGEFIDTVVHIFYFSGTIALFRTPISVDDQVVECEFRRGIPGKPLAREEINLKEIAAMIPPDELPENMQDWPSFKT